MRAEACAPLFDTQHCPPGRFFALVIGAAVLYISASSPLRRWLQVLPPLPHLPTHSHVFTHALG